MPLLHLIPVQLEVLRGATAGMMIPAVGEQDAADIKEQGRNWDGFFHKIGVLEGV